MWLLVIADFDLNKPSADTTMNSCDEEVPYLELLLVNVQQFTLSWISFLLERLKVSDQISVIRLPVCCYHLTYVAAVII